MSKTVIGLGVFILVYTVQIFAIGASPTEKPAGWASYAGGTSGGNNGTIDTASDLTTLNNLLKQNGLKLIFVKGTISGKVIIGADNKSLLGLPGAKIYGSLQVSNRKNVIVRNLKIQGLPCSTYDECKSGDDAVHIQGSKNVWMDHLDVSDGQDGNLDCNDTSDYITISWCKFSYSNKDKPHKFSNLIGSADSLPTNEGKLNVTYHHCWWSNFVNQRQPRTRYGKIHVVNNFFNSDSSDYCSNAGYHASVMVENNMYLNQKNPVSPDSNSYGCTARGNIFTNCTGNTKGLGTSFDPSKYYDTSFIDPANGLQALITSAFTGAGATLTWNSLAEINRSKDMTRTAVDKQFAVSYKGNGVFSLQNTGSKLLNIRIFDLSGKIIRQYGPVNSGQHVTFLIPQSVPGLFFISGGEETQVLSVEDSR